MKRTLLISLTVLSGCISADGAEQKWDDYVADHNECETADDCVVVYPGCPLGCWDTVAAEHQTAAEEKADKLVASYERGGRACAFDCLAAGEPTCVQGACAVAEASETELACQGSSCGDSCSVCTDDECAEEFCQADGTCAAGEPTCM